MYICKKFTHADSCRHIFKQHESISTDLGACTHTQRLTDAYLRSYNLLKPSYMILVCLPHALCVLLSMHSFKHMLVGCVHVQVCRHIRLRVQTFTNPLGAKPETRTIWKLFTPRLTTVILTKPRAPSAEKP